MGTAQRERDEGAAGASVSVGDGEEAEKGEEQRNEHRMWRLEDRLLARGVRFRIQVDR